MPKWLVGCVSLFLVMAIYLSWSSTAVLAQVPQSTNYRFDESTVGAGGLVQSNSTNFQASQSTGDLGVGNAASENFQVEAGSQTTNEPTLKFAINNTDPNFGSFSANDSAVTSASFTISNYTSYGYVVQISGGTPKNGTYALPAMTETSSPEFGVEQFGINLVANTFPESIGANPDYGEFGVGSPAPNYGESNKYRYVSGETIATAPKSSGATTYTISYLVNVDSLTPGGIYTSNQTLIVTGTY